MKYIYNACIDAVSPYDLVIEHARALKENSSIHNYKRIYVVAVGKAAFEMSRGLYKVLGKLITRGIIITKDGHLGRDPLKRFDIYEASHTVRDERGVIATEKVMDLLRGSDDKTLVIFLISGGGSALLVAPHVPPIDFPTKQTVIKLLLRENVDIASLNAVQKHISAVKGGRLAKIAHPASVISFILSDVVGDNIEVICSGPTAPDSSTFVDALAVIRDMRVIREVPMAAIKMLMLGATGNFPETPKYSEHFFNNVENVIIGNNTMGVMGGRSKALSLGYNVNGISESMIGEARESGVKLAKTALKIQRDIRQSDSRPFCLISGGETTVTLKGQGKGGRNMELALAFALEIDGVEGISLLSADTDGFDGQTDAAGAFADGSTMRLARKRSMDPREYLDNNDSYTFFNTLNDLFKTGPTGTSVMDLQIVIIE